MHHLQQHMLMPDSAGMTLVWFSWVQYSMKSDPTFPQCCNMFSFFTLVISCVEFFGLDFLLSELWHQQCGCIQGNTMTFSVFNHSCVCFRPVWEMMKAGAVFHSFCWVEVLLCFEGNVTDLVPLHLSTSFWNLQPSGLYRFCPSFLFASCWDSNLKQRWRFRTARRNSAVSFKNIKRELCWWLRDPDIRLYRNKIQQGNTAVMFLAACDVSWVWCPVLSFPQCELRFSNNPQLQLGLIYSGRTAGVLKLLISCCLTHLYLYLLQGEIKITFLLSWTGHRPSWVFMLVQTSLCWLVLVYCFP